MAFSPNKPYDELPLLPPSPEAYENVDVYRKLARSRASLAELKGRLPVIPNPLMLINTLVLQEARDSSSIENIFTTNDKLFRAFASGNAGADPATKEVLRYREALWEAYGRLEENGDWSAKLTIAIFQKITGKDETLRDKQNYIVAPNVTIYTPPSPGETLKAKLDNFFEYIHAEDGVDPLIKLAIMHYQFEAIHPFSDGNGRTGRILSVLYLTRMDLLELPVLYLSKYIVEFKRDYYRLLEGVTVNGEWANWILYMLEAIEQTARFTLDKVNAIYALLNEIKAQIQREAGDIYSYELLEVLFSQPYCKIGILLDKGIASRNTASKYLKRLAALGILSEIKEGRETLFLNKRLYELLGGNTIHAQ